MACRCRGFTLTELLVVVALLAIIARTALPSAAPGAEAKLDAAAAEVAAALRFARAEAMRKGTVHGADFSLDAGAGSRRVRVFRTDTATPPNPVYDVRHPVDKKLYDLQLSASTATSGVALDQATLYYSPGGAPIVRDWAAFTASGAPVYYPNSAGYTPYSQAPYVSAVSLSFQGLTRSVLLDPVTGRVTIQ